MFRNFENKSGSKEDKSSSGGAGEDTDIIKEAKGRKLPPTEYVYEERDVMLYNLGIGAKASDLPLVFEGADGFKVSAKGVRHPPITGR
jgi:multifunctional beta-oxidation protein